ncbi:MAG: aldehyde reductase [Alphaproteobacteria bacterium]|nr:aldehyde reductase [Alphaproteobacteria bacterium]
MFDPSRPILVTGGSGYIAGFCIRQLIAEGHSVRATIRSLAREEEVRGWLDVPRDKLSFAAADLNATEGWAEAVAGVGGILHVASPIPPTLPKNDDELVRPARDGALRVLKAAKAAGVGRVVMTSSTAAVTYGHERPPSASFDETYWTDPTHPDTSPYIRSKTIAERAAWDYVRGDGAGIEFVTVNPGAVLGPVMGRDFSASIEIVKKLLEGSLPGMPRLGFPLVDVRDIADLHVRALKAPAAGVVGERFLGAGRFFWMSDIADILRARLGAKAAKVPKGKVPDWTVRFLANFDPVTKSVVFELGKERPVTSAKAERVLGWRMRAPEDTIVETAESLIAARVV